MAQALTEDFPTTFTVPKNHGELEEPMTRLLNGPFAQRRYAFAAEDPQAYQRFLEIESRLRQALWGQNGAEKSLSGEQQRDFAEVVRLLGGKLNGTGVLHTLKSMGSSVWESARRMMKASA